MITISPGTVDDHAELLELEHKGFPAGERWSEDGWRQELANDHRVVLVARDKAGLVGAITLSVSDTAADLLRIVVAESKRRKGFGRQLLDAGIDAIRSRGVKTIMLEVRFDNESAIALYQAIGFEQLGARSHYYGPDQHALIMKLYDLTPRGSDAGIGRRATDPPAGETISTLGQENR